MVADVAWIALNAAVGAPPNACAIVTSTGTRTTITSHGDDENPPGREPLSRRAPRTRTLTGICALATREISANALRVAAIRGRLKAAKAADGTWRSSQAWVQEYAAARYKR